MQELERIETELRKTLQLNAERPSPELLARANELRRLYAERDVKINRGKQ